MNWALISSLYQGLVLSRRVAVYGCREKYKVKAAPQIIRMIIPDHGPVLIRKPIPGYVLQGKGNDV